MALTLATFVPMSSMANSNAPRMFSYASATDTLANVKASGYFNAAAASYGLATGDVILVSPTNTVSFLNIAVNASGVATVASASDFA